MVIVHGFLNKGMTGIGIARRYWLFFYIIEEPTYYPHILDKKIPISALNYKIGKLEWGGYVKCYYFSIFVVVDNVYYKYQYSKTYTLWFVDSVACMSQKEQEKKYL